MATEETAFMFGWRDDAASKRVLKLEANPTDGTIGVFGSGVKAAPEPIWLYIGPAQVLLTEEKALELANALTSAVERRRNLFSDGPQLMSQAK
ncbi:hypothetical protein [Dyella silvae]|uniref:hypothetical protein n=1 Tax=Dyella silvae TaxID=2994424 RepID=UPI002264EC70|nr:hypothetical protein [Dyella silvae]